MRRRVSRERHATTTITITKSLPSVAIGHLG
eukprot:CAMPEP_0198725870 /NCGR_PEP_ID=MMETSP1475-20131203/3082_1 /TAXON_ID= ORGANISM="Unidentified sp., Strain CCMP1999" /NCGR_SAMPLE_ID=MMETSP1475 /ASSEMBLY_ACC=CAM_ASM_001111 /LENGTH=30 /DNA_ID= /DNA_START= /DNA_END= /DNA_ORIENTATION=